MVPGLIGVVTREDPGAGICGIPHLAKNERDVGHPGLVALSSS
jgi:hypothetical protein